MRIACLLLILLCGALAPLSSIYAQEEDEQTPEPYQPEEFPDWLHGVRRAEILALGSFPITYLFTTLIFDLVRFGVKSAEAGQLNATYAPIFFASPDKPSFTNEEQVGLLVASLSLSVVVVIIDLIIRSAESRREKRAKRPTTAP